MREVFDQVPGMLANTSGQTGRYVAVPGQVGVSAGVTGHTEAVVQLPCGPAAASNGRERTCGAAGGAAPPSVTDTGPARPCHAAGQYQQHAYLRNPVRDRSCNTTRGRSEPQKSVWGEPG